MKLAGDMLTHVRQRVIREAKGRRGRSTDPAWTNRRLLLRAGNTLSPRALARLKATLRADDPTDEIGAAWGVKEQPRLAGVPPQVAAQALILLPPHETTARLNIGQPPMTWLVDQVHDLSGHVSGHVTYAFVRFSGIRVPARAARILADRVADWPATDDLSPGLDCAQGSTWTSRSTETPSWAGHGSDLLDMHLPPDIAEVGLAWR